MSYDSGSGSGSPYGGGAGNPYDSGPLPSSTPPPVVPLPTPTPVLDVPPPPPPPTASATVTVPAVMLHGAVLGSDGTTLDPAAVRSWQGGAMVGGFGACLALAVVLFLLRSFFIARSSSNSALARGRTGIAWAVGVCSVCLLLGVYTAGVGVFAYYLLLHPSALTIPKLLSVLVPGAAAGITFLSHLALAYSAFWLLAQPASPGGRRSSLSHRLTAAAVTGLVFLSSAAAATGILAAVKSTQTNQHATWQMAEMISSAVTMAVGVLFSLAIALPRWRLWARRALVARRDTYVFDEKAGLRIPRTVEEGAARPRGWGEWAIGTCILQSGALVLLAQGAHLGTFASGANGWRAWSAVPGSVAPAIWLATALRWLCHFLVHPPAPAPLRVGVEGVEAFLADPAPMGRGGLGGVKAFVLDDGDEGRVSSDSLEKGRGMLGGTPDVPAIYALYADGGGSSGRGTPGHTPDIVGLPARPPPIRRQGTDDSVGSGSQGSSHMNKSRWSGSTCSPRTAAGKFFPFKGKKNGGGRSNATPTPPPMPSLTPSTSRNTPTPDSGRRSPNVEVIGRPGDALAPPVATSKPVAAGTLNVSAPIHGGLAAPVRPALKPARELYSPPNRGGQLSLRVIDEDGMEAPQPSPMTSSDAFDLDRFAESPTPAGGRQLAPGVQREEFRAPPPSASRGALAAANRAEERAKVKWADNVRGANSNSPSPPVRPSHLSQMSAVSSVSNYSRD